MKREMSVALAILLLVGTVGPAAAMGPVEAGVKGGVNFANQSADPDDAELADSRMGLALGGFVGFPVLPSVTIQPEALFMMKGDEEEADGASGSYKLNYIEVPVLAKIGFMSQSPAHPSIFLGPSFGINTTAKAEGESGGLAFEADVKDETNVMDIGVVVGGGVDFANFGVDVRYTRGFTNVNDSSTDDTTINNSVISVMGSLRFL
jgi:hypothetical protein